MSRLLIPWLGTLLLISGCEADRPTGDGRALNEPAIVRIEPGNGRRILLVSPHADDLALFIGGTVAAWADAGWHLIAVRVTDDRWDSVDLSEADTIERSHAEFERAMAVLGVAETVHLNFPTDVLGDTSHVALREHFIRLVRLHRPYALVSVDPHSGTGEDNLDHLVVGEAVAEAVWTAQFDKHHPEHLAEGLAPHGVVEQWYYGRPPGVITDVVDISATLDRKVAAALAHESPLRNIVHQLRLQARTAGIRVPALDEAVEGDLTALVEGLVKERTERQGEHYGIGAAEVFRVSRGNLAWLEANGIPLE